MAPTARDVVDVLLDYRAELVATGSIAAHVDTLDRTLARIAKRLAVPPAPVARDEAHRAALLVLELRDRAIARTCTHDAAALMRSAQLLANEARLRGDT